MDVATLSYSVDSSGLERGERALDDTTKAAENAGKAVEQLDDRFKGIARRAVEFAEANRVGNQSERSLAEAAREAAAGIDTKTQVMARSGTEAERMARRVEQMRVAEERLTREQTKAAQAATLQELNLKKLVGQIDPTIAKLERLAQQESQLEKAFDAGAINPQVFQQYQSRIDATRAATLNAGRANDVMTKSLGSLNLQSVETQQSVAALGRALATGQWGQAQASMTSLVARTGVLTSAFTAAALPIGALIAAVGGLAIAYNAGWRESKEFDQALIGNGNSAGVSTGQLIDLRNELGRATGDYKGAGEAIKALAADGRIAGDMLESLARTAGDIAMTTGRSFSTASSDIQSLVSGGSAALVDLNNKYNFLTVETYRYIESIRAQKGETEALQATMIELESVVSDRARLMVENIGYIERALRAVTNEGKAAIAAFKGIGRSDLEYQIQNAERLVESQRMAAGIAGYTGPGSPLDAAQKQLAVLQDRKRTQDLVNKGVEDGMRFSREAVAAAAKENEWAKGASAEVDRMNDGLSRGNALMRARGEIIQAFNKLSIENPNDARLYDGTQERLLAAAEKRVNEQFDRKDRPKANANDNAANNFLKNIQRQIEANEQLAESGVAVSTSERLVIQARQLLSDSTNKMTGATRAALEAAIPMLENTDKQAKATQQLNRDRSAQAALTERLAQAEKVRRDAAEIDLMGLSRGSDATDMLRRQLDIQREYLREVEQLERAQRNKNTALSQQEYELELTMLSDSKQRRLDIERQYQEQRLAMMGDWRNGAQRAMDDYLAEGQDIAGQYNRAFTNAFQGMEDAFAQFATTGKLSFSDLARSIISDLGRIAAKQLVTGLVGNIFGGMFGGAMGATNAAGASSASLMSGSSFTLQGASNGGLANGGPTYAGMVNRVGEKRPEMYTENGKQYLIPGNNGRVNPMAPARAGGGGVVNNINIIGAPEGTTATASQNAQGGFDLEVMMGQIRKDIAGNIASGGVVGSAIKSRYGVRESV